MIAVNVVFVVCVFFGTVSSSAIPMWEYLTQDEKIMYLYNMFQAQVQDFCETSTCKQELKNYGWNKLKNMPEDHLDKMDPFQRGSNNIIWEGVMDGHEMMKTTKRSKTTSTLKPSYFEEEPYRKGEDSDASAKIETNNRIPPPKGFSINYPEYTVVVNKPEYKVPDEETSYTDNSYTSSNNIQEITTQGIPIINSYGEYRRIPLTGPMVIKVHLDGTPVRDDNETLPEDDDLRQYQLTKTMLQNI